MIPPFDHSGYLPQGIHEATLAEVKKRFTGTPKRKRLFSGLKSLAEHLKLVGCKTLYLDGSFVTDKPEPGDYDAVYEPAGVNNQIDRPLRDSDQKAIKRKYGGDVFCRVPLVIGVDLVEYFQTDRENRPKGLIKIDLRKRL